KAENCGASPGHGGRSSDGGHEVRLLSGDQSFYPSALPVSGRRPGPQPSARGGPGLSLREIAEADAAAGVEKSVESNRSGQSSDAGSLAVRLLGSLSIERDGAPIPLPASRKVRALLAYLSLAPHPPTRS